MKMGRISLISILMVSIFASRNLVSMSSSSSDIGIAASAEHIRRLVEAQVGSRMASLEGKISGYERALRSFANGARKSSSWMPSLLTMGKVGVCLGVVGGVCYGGYYAYKKFAWLHGIVDDVIDKAKGLSRKWLDIPAIKERLESVLKEITQLSTKIATLTTGQQHMQEDLSSIRRETSSIRRETSSIRRETSGMLEKLNAGELRDRDAAQQLQRIEQKLNVLTQYFKLV